jgi:hypothetical protein
MSLRPSTRVLITDSLPARPHRAGTRFAGAQRSLAQTCAEWADRGAECIGHRRCLSDNQERTVVVTSRVLSRMLMAVVLGCVSMVVPAEAQLNTQHIKGTVGLKSGSQAPPGVYFIAPLFYVYKTDEVKDRDESGFPSPRISRARCMAAASTSLRKETVRRFLRLPGGVSSWREQSDSGHRD